MSHPVTPPANPILAQAEQEADRYEWTAAAKLYEEALNGVDKNHDPMTAAQINEQIAYSRFRAAFQAKDREQFKVDMKRAEALYKDASNLYEGGNREALSKRARARSIFASFFSQDSNEERRITIQQCISLAEDAATSLNGEVAKKTLAETHLDLIHYYGEAIALSPELKERKQLFEKTLQTGKTAIREFESLGTSKDLVRSIAITVGVTGGSAELLLDPPAFQEFSQMAQTFSARAMEIAQRLETPYELGLAHFAAAVATTGIIKEWSKGLDLVKTGIQLSEKSRDAYLLGDLSLYGITAAFWSSWNEVEEDVERTAETLRDGIRLATDGIRYLEIPLASQEIAIGYGWCAECYRALSDLSDDLEKKKEYLNQAVEIARKGLKYVDPKLPSDTIHALSKSLLMQAMLEPDLEKRTLLLKESLRLREQIMQWGEDLFPKSWDHGVMYNYRAVVKAELSKNEENPQTRLALLQSAVSDMQQCLEICTTWAKDPSYMHATAFYAIWYGEILGQLYRLTEDAQDGNKAIQAYQDAINLLEKSGYTGQIPPIIWDIAKIQDRIGNYKAAAEQFHRAAEEYRRTAAKIHAFASTFTELASYMDSWSLIEKARLAHNDEQYSPAAEDYAKAASTLKQTRTWNHLVEHYEACSLLEEGESHSRQENEEKAVECFAKAAEHFDAGTKILEARLRQATEKEAEELRNWLKLTETRMKYARARENMEKARLFDGKGEKTNSLTNYRKASEIFKELIPETQNEQGRREIETLAFFCDAWAKMKEAETKASADLYIEAADLFEKAEQASEKERSDRLALANAAICRALAAGTRFRRARDTQLYSEIKRDLETAADYYQEGGFAKAANWTRATQRLFDALLYLGDAEAEKEARKKAELYHLAEQHLQLAAKIYGEAGFASKRDEAQRHLERAREEKAILLTPLEVLAENPTVSAGAASPVSLVRDQAVGAERYESANVVGNLNLHQKDVNVGGDLSLELEIANVGKTPAMLMKLENLAPEGFEIQHEKTPLHVEDGFINMRGKRLEYLKTDQVKIALKALRKGAYKLRPRILFVDDKGSYRSYDFEPTEVTVSELGISGWLRGTGR